jgi:hypothetical protein
LVRARTRVAALDNTSMLARSSADGLALLVALNLADEAVELELPSGEWAPVAGTGQVDGPRLTLAGHGWCVLS